MNDIIDILVNFGGGRGGEASGTVVRFLLPVFFWLVLAAIAGGEWQKEQNRKDKYIVLAALTGTARELLMFMAEYGSHRGYFSFDTLYRFYPPLEHAATMLSGIFITYAFMQYCKDQKIIQSRFIVVSTFITLVTYSVTAAGWPSFLAANPNAPFSMYGGDLAFRITASLILGFALAIFINYRLRGTRISKSLMVGIAFLLLDELLMILNVFTQEHYGMILAPLRHNLHIWAIPFFIATYWFELAFTRRQAELKLREQHQKLEELNATLEARINKAVDSLHLQDWFKTGLNQLGSILRGDKSSADMANGLLTFLIEYLGAGVGVFYLNDEAEKSLEIVSTYAVSGGKHLHERVAFGDGLAGQVAVELKTIYLKDVPHNYLPIGSALGVADPLNIVVLPVIKDQQLVGVLEIGSFKLFKPDDFEFLNQSMDDIAIAFSVNRSRELVNALLETTQAQAEELMVQQEELQQTNEELEERTQILIQQGVNIPYPKG